MADSMNDLEPVVWERGDGKILYQPRCNDRLLCWVSGYRSWELLTFTRMFNYRPVLYRTKKRALRVAKRHANRVAKSALKEVREATNDRPEA